MAYALIQTRSSAILRQLSASRVGGALRTAARPLSTGDGGGDGR